MAKVATMIAGAVVLWAGIAVAQVAMCPDGRWHAGGTCTRCPDGKWTTAPACQRTPSGEWVADYGKGLRLAPDRTWIPDGIGVVQCPDGRWHAGETCVFLPDQRWTGGSAAPAPR